MSASNGIYLSFEVTQEAPTSLGACISMLRVIAKSLPLRLTLTWLRPGGGRAAEAWLIEHFKPTRTAIARALDVAADDPRLEWVYASEAGEYTAVRVEAETITEKRR